MGLDISTSTDKQALNALDHHGMQRLCQHAMVKTVHADSLYAAVYRHRCSSIAHITGLPKRLQRYLEEHYCIQHCSIQKQYQDGDGTHKLLLHFNAGHSAESVLIPSNNRLTQCISTQIGCAMGCRFCLTAKNGLLRNLTCDEMVAQVYAGQQESQGKVSNLVLMGMGEPLHNFDAVTRFIGIATDPKGMAFSPRRVTVSSVGLVPAIRRFMASDVHCSLAISLNASTDAIRDELMPINKSYPLAMLMDCLKDYTTSKNCRILIEYVLLAGVNDSQEDAYRVLDLLDGIPATINLLPFNHFSGSPWQRPSAERIEHFRCILADGGRLVTIRKTRGETISAACGQLYNQHQRSHKRTLKA